MILSNQVGEKLFSQCIDHFTLSNGKIQGTLIVERLNMSSGGVVKMKGFRVLHSGQFKFELLKNKKGEYEFNGEFEGFYKTNPRTAQKITAFPTPASVQFSPEMSV